MEQEIKIRLQFYRKDEIFVALLVIKEVIRRKLLLKNNNQDWLVISDASTVNLLMKLASKVCYFENHPICELENGCSNFVNAIFYARRYNMIIENMELMSGKVIQLEDICFEPIQTEETERYFDIYLKNGLDEKPEDYKIQNEVLLKRLENENKTPNKILESLNNLLNIEFGFTREQYQLLSVGLFRMEFPEKNDFYEVSQFVVFGNFDFAQTISIFEKFLLSGHYIDIYKENISQNKKIKKAQNALSKYFSASVADYLSCCGYDLPMESYFDVDIPRAEIENIDVQGKNILINENNEKMGDIDVLALNQEKNEILVFELKFYKPTISMKDMLLNQYY